jgi:hypothetical protein
MNPLDTQPMMSLDKFIEQTGLSAVTLWRYRKKGMITTVNICGRQYILRSEIARFNQRAAAGEFAKPPNQPVGQPRECMGRGRKNVGHSSGFSPASPQNEFLGSSTPSPATQLA